jgi:hypothetical protein
MDEWKKISAISDIRRGASPRPIDDPRYFGGSVGWVRIVDVTRSSRFLRSTEQYLSPLGEALSVRVNPGDLVMSICGTLGRPIIIDMPACIHDGFVQFSNLREIESTYLFYALQNAEPAFYGMGQSGTQTNLNTSLVGRHSIFCPDRREQGKIVEILTALDESMEQAAAQISKYQRIKIGLMQDLFTRGLNSEGQLRPHPSKDTTCYKRSDIGWIPCEWDVQSIGQLFMRRSQRGKPGLPIMSVTMNGGLVERNSTERRVETALRAEDHLLAREGDIAYNMMRMWQGVFGRASFDCLISPAYIVLQPTASIDSVFAKHLFSAEATIAKFKQLSYGIVDDRLRLYFRDIVRIRLALPNSLIEQRAVAAKLDQIDAVIPSP